MIVFSQLGKLGRFGNALFQISGTIGIAIKSNQSFAFPLFINHDHKDRFGSSEDVDLYKHFVNHLPLMPTGFDSQCNKVDYFWGYRDLYYPEGNWDFHAHFQSQKYFSHCEKEVRYYLTMKGEKDFPSVCAIHMRFGDYDNNYHPRPRLEYYQEAVKHIPNGSIFLLFSDDLKLAGELMQGIPIDYIPVDENYIESFKIMKRCSHFITGNSSYSLMAAILSPNPEKVIVSPKKFFGPAWGNPEDMAKDIYPFNAIVI